MKTDTEKPAAFPAFAADNQVAERRAGFQLSQLVWFIFGLIEMLLGLRFLLRALGANEGNAIVSTVYSISQPFVAPFSGIIANTSLNGNVFEWSVLIALFVYALIAWAIVYFLKILFPPAVA